MQVSKATSILRKFFPSLNIHQSNRKILKCRNKMKPKQRNFKQKYFVQ